MIHPIERAAVSMQSFLLIGTVILLSIECRADEMISSAIGVTRRGTSIPCEIDPADLSLDSDVTRILLVAGADGEQASVDAADQVANWFHTSDAGALYRDDYSLSVLSCLNPDGLTSQLGCMNGSGGDVTRGYSVSDAAYFDETCPETIYAWRWIGMHAPDLVVEFRAGEENRWEIVEQSPEHLERLAARLDGVNRFPRDDSLVSQLVHNAACEMGAIPAIRWLGNPDHAISAVQDVLQQMEDCDWQPSSARLELLRRLDREPQEIVEELLDHYGKEMNAVVYIEALAVIGRQRHLARVYAGESEWLAPIEEMVAPYFNGEMTPRLENGSDVSGHLIFIELARATEGERQDRYVALAQRAADLAFGSDGALHGVMPFHNEMSDAVFMGGPILASVGALTGERRYFDACLSHIRFMRALDQREDGLYRHSPLDEAAWGRGNGFPAIGVAMCLDDLPETYPGRDEVLTAFRKHMEVLVTHQDETGCWHQVIDHPESYREFTATCMITYAMLRGVREGWLDADTYDPVIQRAWNAIKSRIGPGGRLVDVCAGTGKQTSLRAYYDRPAMLGIDARGGAMALLVCNEMALYQAAPL